MYRNYLLTTIRALVRNKAFTAINIFGFAAGIACVILFYLWVVDEVSYDRFHENRNRIMNLLSVFPRNDMNSMAVTPFPLAPAMYEKFPEVEDFTRFWQFPALVSYKETTNLDKKVCLVDSGFFNMFSFPVISGNPKEAVSNKSSVVITESEAVKYFGEDDPIGRILTFNKDLKLTVMAVVKDPPRNTVFDFTMLASILHVPEYRLYNDWSFAGPSYVMLSEGTDRHSFQEKIRDLYRDRDAEMDVSLVLQPLKEVYLYRDGKANRIIYVYLFSGIAIIILLLACFNYMNLSIARSLKRSKEIGLRKTNGAGKNQIVIQFLGESMFYSLISLFIALILVELARPLFNSLTMKQLELHYNDPLLITGLIAIYIFTSLASGLYPAFILSSFRPAEIFYGKTGFKGKGNFLNTLIILQFAISTALIIASVTVNRQVNYIRKKDLGLNKEKVIVLPFGRDMIPMYEVVREQIMAHSAVVNVSASYDLPFFLTSGVSFTWDTVPVEDRIGVSYNMVDYDFIETMEIDMLEGRSFSREYAGDDSVAYIINETALRKMGVDHATGLDIHFRHPHLPEYLRKGTIIGVIKDFNTRPLKEEIPPLVLRIYRPFYRNMYIRYNTEDPSDLLQYLQGVQSQLYPGLPFQYSFLDQEADQLYSVEFRTGRILRYFTLISILISCLGLFGMVSYDLELRIREIAIRKVFASSVGRIILLIFSRYLRWITIAFILAVPAAWYLTRKWLQEFVFRIEISVLSYLISLILVILIAFITISFLSGRTARINPAAVLKQN